MHTQRSRSRADIALAIERLSSEPIWLPVAEFRSQLGKPKDTIVRWIVHGFRGVYLDAIKTPDRGWVTSPEAVKRFMAAKAAIPKSNHDGDEPDRAA